MSTSQIVSTSEQIDLKLEGMTCSACVAAIERSLNGLEGISATVNFATESAHIFAPKGYKASALIDVVKKTGYGATLLADETESFSRSRRMGWRVFFAAILPAFVDQEKNNVTSQLLFLGLVFVTIAFISDSTYGILAGTVRQWLASDLSRLIFMRRFGGCVMIALGLFTIFSAVLVG